MRMRAPPMTARCARLQFASAKADGTALRDTPVAA